MKSSDTELSDGGGEGEVTADVDLNGEAGDSRVICTEASDLDNSLAHLVLMLIVECSTPKSL